VVRQRGIACVPGEHQEHRHQVSLRVSGQEVLACSGEQERSPSCNQPRIRDHQDRGCEGRRCCGHRNSLGAGEYGGFQQARLIRCGD
tara:strand:- start:1892 stop:2152 length:261 start_codon:yes stop_codon:yes gene_type:complete